MTQTKLGSLIEAIVNILIGFLIAFVAQMLVFPLFGLHASVSQNLQIGAIFTVVSIVRQYAIRRWFNAKIHKMSMKAAEKL